MNLIDIAELNNHWTRIKRPIEILARWDSADGILFESHDDSAQQAVKVLSEYLGGRVVVLDQSRIARAKWKKEVERFLDGSLALASLRTLNSEKLCLVVLDLEKKSEQFCIRLKMLFEHGKRPFCCLATTQDKSKVHRSLASFLFHVKKIGRPRRSEPLMKRGGLPSIGGQGRPPHSWRSTASERRFERRPGQVAEQLVPDVLPVALHRGDDLLHVPQDLGRLRVAIL